MIPSLSCILFHIGVSDGGGFPLNHEPGASPNKASHEMLLLIGQSLSIPPWYPVRPLGQTDFNAPSFQTIQLITCHERLENDFGSSHSGRRIFIAGWSSHHGCRKFQAVTHLRRHRQGLKNAAPEIQWHIRGFLAQVERPKSHFGCTWHNYTDCGYDSDVAMEKRGVTV
ncbi:hypothetical protein K402DRAFT_169611 [Aulographum hederae CBS 113979]|uniref:Uncharacterized protein n=1 Tax=Aulographum hederae CBS 113979 TaxID=1176131 RepID=A0A6G1HDA9_9PEZI|nr:hypothetical protein K402DRAFT_169611 [Aulographum hederae CBS 113979]